jgi:hypothetical protein
MFLQCPVGSFEVGPTGGHARRTSREAHDQRRNTLGQGRAVRLAYSRQLLAVAGGCDVLEAVLGPLRLARMALQHAQQEAAQHLAALRPRVREAGLYTQKRAVRGRAAAGRQDIPPPPNLGSKHSVKAEAGV